MWFRALNRMFRKLLFIGGFFPLPLFSKKKNESMIELPRHSRYIGYHIETCLTAAASIRFRVLNRMFRKLVFIGAFLALPLINHAQTKSPAVTQTMKPWVRWWWMGSAVDEAGIKKQLTQLSSAGFGGVEIVPIYGAKGFESRYIKYLSPQWMKMLDYTVQQAKAFNMGVYISVGTGWPI